MDAVGEAKQWKQTYEAPGAGKLKLGGQIGRAHV